MGVSAFAYRIVSLVSNPSSVGMNPSRLLPWSSLPTRWNPKKRKQRQQCASRCPIVIIVRMKSVKVAGFTYSCVSCVSIPNSVGMVPFKAVL